MALTVNTNVSALNAQRATLQSQNEMATAMERLATGKRINSAVDDAAGLAIAARMESQISGLNQAVRNANDAISLVQTAEGALQETTAILQRIRELSIQSAGGAPSNADRVNLNKEVVQLQEELARIANTTRFNGGLLLNGTFVATDFQIGQSNNEEITVNIQDVRPERIGAYTQRSVQNVGLVSFGSGLSSIDNGVNQQTLVVQVGNEVPRTIKINKGDDARTISDKLNEGGAQLNTTAVNESSIYIDGQGSFSFKLSSSSTPDIEDTVTVGATAGSPAASLAAEINRGYPEHNISATIEVDDNGVEYVKMVQKNGYDIRIQGFVTTDSNTLDFDADGVAELTGAYGKTATVIGGSVTMDAPASFLISSDDEKNTILQGTRASLEVTGVVNDPAAYQDRSFEVSVNGVKEVITLASLPPEVPTDATSPVMGLEFVASAQTQGPSAQQIGAIRAYPTTIGVIDSYTNGDGDAEYRGSDDLRFSLNVNAGNGGTRTDFDMAAKLAALGYETGDEVSAANFALAMQQTIDEDDYFTGDNAVTVSVTDSGQITLTVANTSGSIDFAEGTRIFSGIAADSFENGDVNYDDTGNNPNSITLTDHEFVTGDRVLFEAGTATTTATNTVFDTAYFVIVVDEDTVQLATSKTNALAGTAIDLDDTTELNGTATLTRELAFDITTAASSTFTLTSHGFSSGDIVTWNGDTNPDDTIDDLTSFYVMVTDANTFELVARSAAVSDVLSGDADPVTFGGNGDGSLTLNGLAERLTGVVTYQGTTETAVTAGQAREQSSSSNTLTLGAVVNAAFENDYGPVKPMGIENRVITAQDNDNFTLAIDGGSPTTITVAAGTYYSMDELQVAVQAAIDESPFEQDGNCPIVVTATTDENGDWGLEFSSAEGFSIQVGGDRFLTSILALSVEDRTSVADIGAIAENTIALSDDGSGNIPDADDTYANGGASFTMAIKVNGGSFVDIDLSTYLADAGVEASDSAVTETQFVTALQAALDDEQYFKGENALTVSVTDAGLVKLTVAGGVGTIAVAEHSNFRYGESANAGNGLAETLTGTVANGIQSNAGDAYQLGSDFSITLGATANAANGDPTSDPYVKTFGMASVTVTAGESDEIYMNLGEAGQGTLLTIPDANYTTMADLATAIQSVIKDKYELQNAAGEPLVTVTAVQNSADDSWGLDFTSTEGDQVDLWGNFFVKTAFSVSVGTDNDEDGDTEQLGDAVNDAFTINTSDINTTRDEITISGHGMVTGQAVTYAGDATVSGGAALTGSADANSFLYAVVVDANTIKLATSATNANAATPTTIDLESAGTADSTITHVSERYTIAAQGEPPYGAARYRTSVDAGDFTDGVDLSVDNTLSIQVVDDRTGIALTPKVITLGSSSQSVSFADYAALIATAATESFTEEGFYFEAVTAEDGSLSLVMGPEGGRTVTISGTSATQAFGGPVSASGAESNRDGVAFETMDDVVTSLNAQLAAAGLEMTATYTRGGDTFNFYVNGGPADSSSTIALGGDALVDLGFTGTLTAIGGGTHKTEDVRYVSQIDISTRETAKMAMTVVDAALETLASVRGGLGAVANRLESTISNLMNISENTSASMSRVMDADFAQESTRLARAQILQEASVAMLAQANQAAQSVLKLLQ